MHRLPIIILSAIILSGCAMFDHDSKPSRDFPAWASSVFHGALNAARAAIESKGIKLKEYPVRGQVIVGKKKFGSVWGWYVVEPSWPGGGMYVGGLTSGNGRLVQIVIDPSLPGDPTAINIPSLIHEMAHHWLIVNGFGGGHDPMFDDVIPGWAAARAVVGTPQFRIR